MTSRLTLLWALRHTFLAALLAAASMAFAAESPTVTRATLDNGLQVVVVRNTLAPVVSTVMNYLVGSDDTPPGFPGTAHALEHMMFRGSPGLSADQLAVIASDMGGNFNAATRESVTQYFFTVPAENLDLVLRIEAMRMAALSATQADWNQERGAIEQEVAQDLSNPFYKLYSQLREILFAGTPYEHDPLGSRPSFEKTTAAALQSFRDDWYVPNNAVLVIAGNVDPQATIAKVRERFVGIRPGKLPARSSWAFQPVARQSLSLTTDFPYAMQVMAFRLPGTDSEDYAAAQVLSDVLGSKRGELYKLVLAGEALQAGFEFSPLRSAGLGFGVVAFPSSGDAKAMQQKLRDALGRIVSNGVPADLVAAAKLQERRGLEFQKNSISDTAMLWSDALAVEGLRSPEENLERIEKVTVEDVNRVARKYLDFDHAVTASLTPGGEAKPLSAQAFGGKEKPSLPESASTALPEWAASAMKRLEVPASVVNPEVSTLPNGITLIVQPESVSDTVSLYGYVRNRPELQVPKGQEGLSQVLDRLFPYGTERLDRSQFDAAVDELGAEVRAGLQFSAKSLSQNFGRAVELLAENELHPRLPEDAFRTVKQQVSQAVAGERTTPSYHAQRALQEAVLPEGDPLLREPLPQTVDALTLEQVRSYYWAALRPDLAVIVVTGHITPAEARSLVEKAFGGWRADGAKPETELPPVPPNGAATVLVPDPVRVQDTVTLAEQIGVPRLHPDYYALQLGNSVLGGSFYSSRLTRDIRKQAGLVYTIRSELQSTRTRGVYSVRYASDPQNVGKVRDLVALELKSLQTQPVPEDELTRAKALLLRRIVLQEESEQAIALGLIQRWVLTLPLDEPTRSAKRFLSLTPEEVRTAFSRWIRPDSLVLVSRGPEPPK